MSKLSENVVVVTRYTNKNNLKRELKTKAKRKIDTGQCRVTIPRKIADKLKLKHGDRLDVIEDNHNIIFKRFVDKSFEQL